MGKLTFEDVKSHIDYKISNKIDGFTFPLLPHYNKIVGNIEAGQVTVVTGLPSSGTTSFIDQNYIMSVLLQWYNTPVDDRIPLKIFYYSIGTFELKKLQGLLCNYIKLVNGLHVDIPTLNSQAGSLYQLGTDKKLLLAIDEASHFFNEVIDEGVLVLQEARVNPTDIYNEVSDYVNTLGNKTSDGFTYDDEYEHALTLVVVDDTDKLALDMDGYGVVRGEALHEKFRSFIRELHATYAVSFVLSVPSKVGYVRSMKDTEPHIKHIGNYASIADKAVSIYNPILEKNAKFYNADESLYVTAKGNTLLRTWHVIRNSDGIESIYNRMFFLPGTSFMVEYDKFELITDIDEVLEALSEKTVFYVKED